MPRPRKPDTTDNEQPLLINIHDFTPDPDLEGTSCNCQLPRHNRHHNDAFLGPAPTFPTTTGGTRPTSHNTRMAGVTAVSAGEPSPW